ncbi:MAG: MBL fold metallo-hydrolase [Thermomicrobiales bacterium]|nr:MBL fold metallo-hydrolase [Thermomicrobiales bacterium]
MVEVAPGIERIESVFGPRPFAQYVLRADRSMLIDTGIDATPGDVIVPFFERAAFSPESLTYVLTSHADVDHFGGNAALRTVAPQAIFCASTLDVPIITNRERAMAERYGWYAEHGAGADYDADTKELLAAGMGPDTDIDIELTGGEWFRLGPKLRVQILTLPGHSAGHLGVWEPESRSAIVIDAVLGQGLYNFDHEVIHPPPYMDAAAYEGTIETLRALQPERLLTAHYDVMEGAEVRDFLDTSAGFVDRARAAVRRVVHASGTVTLAGLLAELGPELGPFTSFPNELAGPIRSHLRELVAEGVVEIVPGAKPPTWKWTG